MIKKWEDILVGIAMVAVVLAAMYMVYPTLFWVTIIASIIASITVGILALRGVKKMPTLKKLATRKRKDVVITL